MDPSINPRPLPHTKSVQRIQPLHLPIPESLRLSLNGMPASLHFFQTTDLIHSLLPFCSPSTLLSLALVSRTTFLTTLSRRWRCPPMSAFHALTSMDRSASAFYTKHITAIDTFFWTTPEVLMSVRAPLEKVARLHLRFPVLCGTQFHQLTRILRAAVSPALRSLEVSFEAKRGRPRGSYDAARLLTRCGPNLAQLRFLHLDVPGMQMTAAALAAMAALTPQLRELVVNPGPCDVESSKWVWHVVAPLKELEHFAFNGEYAEGECALYALSKNVAASLKSLRAPEIYCNINAVKEWNVVLPELVELEVGGIYGTLAVEEAGPALRAFAPKLMDAFVISDVEMDYPRSTWKEFFRAEATK